MGERHEKHKRKDSDTEGRAAFGGDKRGADTADAGYRAGGDTGRQRVHIQLLPQGGAGAVGLRGIVGSGGGHTRGAGYAEDKRAAGHASGCDGAAGAAERDAAGPAARLHEPPSGGVQPDGAGRIRRIDEVHRAHLRRHTERLRGDEDGLARDKRAADVQDQRRARQRHRAAPCDILALRQFAHGELGDVPGAGQPPGQRDRRAGGRARRAHRGGADRGSAQLRLPRVQ